jgi:hypothetical protein
MYTLYTLPASSKHKNTNKFITTMYTPPLNHLASSDTRHVLSIVCSSVKVYLLFLSTGHSPLTIADSLSAGHTNVVTIDLHGPSLWSALPSGKCSPAVTMPFDSAGLSPVAAIDSSLSIVHDVVVPIPHIGTCNLEPLACLSSPSAAQL